MIPLGVYVVGDDEQVIVLFGSGEEAMYLQGIVEVEAFQSVMWENRLFVVSFSLLPYGS